MSEQTGPRPRNEKAALLATRLGRIFDELISAGQEARAHHDFSNANVSYQAAANVAVTARTLEAEINKQRQMMVQNFNNPYAGEEEE